MSDEALGTYLNDHLAGSVLAIRMLERAAEQEDGSLWGRQLGELLDAIREDQQELRGLIQRLGFQESKLKKAGARVAEQAGRVKLGGDTGTDHFRRLEMLETLAMGIHGKARLWRALRAVSSKYQAIQELDLARLERRAGEQHELVDGWRIEAAAAAL